MREIKLSLKDAREREERNRGENKAGWWEYCHHMRDNFGAIYGVHPPHKPGWHRAPDLAMLKSRPVDPPRERDYAKLTEAAKRKEAPFVDWNGPSSDPCLKYAGIGGGGHASPPASGSGNLPDAAPAPAPVADSAVGEWPKWERDGDVVCRFDAPFTATEYRSNGSWKPIKLVKGEEAGYGEDPTFKPIIQSEALAWLESHGHAQVAAEMRAKERKNVAARAWKAKPGNASNVLLWLFLDGSSYFFGQRNCPAMWRQEKRSQPSVEGLSAHPMFTEIHDPAEIQRLVAELHAAGLGK